MKTFKEFMLTETPQHYSGEVAYQKDTKFRDISISNIKSMNIFDFDDEFYYVIDQAQLYGFVFDKMEFSSGKREIKPVLTVTLRDSVLGFKQAHRLRIRKDYARKNLTKRWYMLYIKEFGGIVSDHEHLEGGKLLWRSFVDMASQRSDVSVALYDADAQEFIMKNISAETPDETIWSRDHTKKNLVMVMTYNG